MNFTDAQSKAINDRNSSLIISAGAGSGKTAVLTERILTRICDENDDCNISDFLVVTFTNAAAKELADRIRKKLTEKAAECPKNKKIAENLALLPLAKISTINSFCYDMVRKNFQKLGLSASLRIGDDAEMVVIRQKIMNEVVNEAFENMGDDGAFITAYEIFSSAKNDKGFVETLLNLHNALTNVPDIEGFCRTVLSRYDEVGEKKEFFLTFFGKKLKKKTEKLLSDNIDALEKLITACKNDKVLIAKYIPSLENERDFARQALFCLDKGYEKTKAFFGEYTSASLKPVKNAEDEELKESVKNSKNRICKSLKEHIGNFYTCDGTLIAAAARDTKNVLACLLALERRFTEKLDAAKIRRRIIEFSDAERYTLKLLVKSTNPFEVTETALAMRERYREIYIDEYQDVNPLQDCIFKALSRTDENGTEYTRFMVGDVKQSIYGFRGARPDIFLSYRNSFSDILSEAKNKRIFMNDNFRCGENVVKFSNYLFSRLMGEYFLAGDELVFSRAENQKVDYKVRLVLAEYDKEILGAETDADTLEASIISDKIKETVGNPKYHDSEGKMFSYCDVAVITRTKKALKIYERVLNEKKIPVVSDVGESFYGKREIRLCCNILESIDNPMRDIQLAGFMRSFVGGFTDDEICIIKNADKKAALYNCVKMYAKGGKQPLREKCLLFTESLRELRRYSHGKSASELLWRIYTEMGLLDYCSGEGFSSDGANARRNLMKLYETALEFNKTSFRGVGAFVEYIVAAAKKDEVKAQRAESGNGVRLMTVHNSKGLEFPVCFVSDISRDFNKSDERKYLVFSENEGLGCTLCDTPYVGCTESDTATVRISTPFKKIIAESIDEQSIKEEVRILYVAMTRARDMLFITGVASGKTKTLVENAKASSFMKNYTAGNSFLSFILASVIDEEASLPLYTASGKDGYTGLKHEISDCFSMEFIPSKSLCRELKNDENDIENAENEDRYDDKIDEELLDRLNELSAFKYAGDIRSPAKITVSMLKKGLIDDEMTKIEGVDKAVKVVSLENDVQKKIPDFLNDKKTADAAEAGTAMHMFMQFVDYAACEKAGGVNKEALRLLEEGFITERQSELLNFEKLEKFFGGSLYENIKNSKQIYREQRFNLEVSAFDEENSSFSDKNILVQGVIDLFYENGDGTYNVVDFKTDRVSGENAEKTLIERHRVQLEYYCRAVEEMTGKRVKHAYLYSFELSKAVEAER